MALSTHLSCPSCFLQMAISGNTELLGSMVATSGQPTKANSYVARLADRFYEGFRELERRATGTDAPAPARVALMACRWPCAPAPGTPRRQATGRDPG